MFRVYHLVITLGSTLSNMVTHRAVGIGITLEICRKDLPFIRCEHCSIPTVQIASRIERRTIDRVGRTRIEFGHGSISNGLLQCCLSSSCVNILAISTKEDK